MSEQTLTTFWWMLAYLLGVLALTLGLYVLASSPRQRANRLVGLMVLAIAVNLVMLGFVLHAKTIGQATIPLIVGAALGPAVNIWLTLAVFVLVKPAWLEGRMRWLEALLFGLILLPIALTVIDVVFNARLYLADLQTVAYAGGLMDFSSYITGPLGRVVVAIYLRVVGTLLVFPLIYLAFFDRSLPAFNRRWARILLLVHLLVTAMNIFGTYVPAASAISLLSSPIYAFVYAYAIFQKMAAERVVQRSGLQSRLTILALVVTIPMLILLSLILAAQAQDTYENEALAKLELAGDDLSQSIADWLHSNVVALRNLAAQPGIISLDPDQQRPILQAFQDNYPYTYLVSTTDVNGMNIARNDDAALTDYSDRSWFKGAITGAVAYQTLIGRTTGRPALVIAVPIRNAEREILGVAMFAADLTDVDQIVKQMNLGENSYAYLVDNIDQLLAHPNLAENATELVDYSSDKPIAALRNASITGEVKVRLDYRDAEGVDWRSYAVRLDNGWGVVVQQYESDYTVVANSLLWTAAAFTLVAILILAVSLWATLRQAIRPIISLTQTVQAITAGRLELEAQVENEDEIGVLARSFNVMTGQVRDLIGSLEQRVAERTLELEFRSAQLQAAADVGRAAATIRGLDDLLRVVVNLVSERFGFYHVGIFLLDERGEYALLRAANSAGGQKMLARGHRLKVGQQGMVGNVTSQRKPRIALNVGQDAVFFNNPDLPETQSEMTLPLVVAEELLGALDVQSTQANAFGEEDLRTLQVLADQVSTAIYSARLVQQVEQALEAERRAYGIQSQQAWKSYIESLSTVGFARTASGIAPLRDVNDPGARQVLQSGQTTLDEQDPAVLYVPVKLRNQVIGVIKSRTAGNNTWTPENVQTIESLVEQLGVALESARVYQETRMRAERERLLSEAAERMSETMDVESVLQTALREIGNLLNAGNIDIHIGTEEYLAEPSSSGWRGEDE